MNLFIRIDYLISVLVLTSVLLPSFLEGRQDGVHDIHPSSLGKVSINLAIVITAISRGSGRLKKK